MIKVIPFATALTAISAVCYTLGLLLALVAPALFLSLFRAWLLLDLAQGVLVTLPGVIIGLVTVIISAWLLGAAWAWLYNTLSRT